MDPIQNALSSLLNALQAASADAGPVLPAPQLPALLALVGQDVNLLFLGAGPDGSQLVLPSGQVFNAQGSMPFPDGTQLLVRILAGTTDSSMLRLQTLEAHPPPPAAILAPLLQGEGPALLGRLGQADPPPALAPLVALYQSLKETPAAADQPAPAPVPMPGTALAAVPSALPSAMVPAGAPGQPDLAGLAAQPPAEASMAGPALPARSQIQAALETLPAPVAAALKAVLPPGPGGSVAAAVETWLTEAVASLPKGAPVQDLLPKFQALVDRHPELPAAPSAALAPFLKALVAANPEVREHRPGPEPAPRPQVPAALSPQPASGGRSGPGPELPETWQSWIRAAVRTLADPVASPREAPFHAAQAKEGTAYYELPLPWAPQTPLQVWVESDRKGQGGRPQDETRTVLVGLNFTRLGETRLGVAKGPTGLQVRVWTEHPECLERDPMEAELRTLGPAVDLRILPLQPGPGGFVPSLRSLVTGPTMQFLG